MLKLDRGNKGYANILALVITFVIAGVAMVIGLFVMGSVYKQIPTAGLPTNISGNMTSVTQQVVSTYSLLPIVLIVLVAAAIIGTLITFGGRRE